MDDSLRYMKDLHALETAYYKKYISIAPALGFETKHSLRAKKLLKSVEKNAKIIADCETTGKPAPHEKNSDEMFEIFWAAYPRKQKKPQAWNAFKKLKISEDLFQKILYGLDKWKKSTNWENPIYQHLASTWLNNEMWNDDVSVKKKSNFEERTYDEAFLKSLEVDLEQYR